MSVYRNDSKRVLCIYQLKIVYTGTSTIIVYENESKIVCAASTSNGCIHAKYPKVYFYSKNVNCVNLRETIQMCFFRNLLVIREDTFIILNRIFVPVIVESF